MERMRCSALICPVGLYIDDVLIYLFDDTHICISCLQNIPKFTIATKIIHLRNRILPFENVSKSPFFSFISLSGFRVCHLYMSWRRSCYLGWIMSLHGYRYSSELDSKLTWPRSLSILNTCLPIYWTGEYYKGAERLV